MMRSLTDESDLDCAEQLDVRASEQVTERRWETKHRFRERRERKSRAAPILGVLLQFGEMEQKLDGERCPGWGRVVSDIARPRYQPLGVARGVEECADLVVPKPFDHRIGDRPRLGHPLFVESQLVNGEKSEG